MFRSTNNKGFQMVFKNGMTISVQFGYGNYCDNHHHPDGWDFSKKQDSTVSSTAEIAIWDSQGNWFNFGYDTVKGHCDPDTVGDWITYTQNSKNLEDLNELVIELGLKSADNE